MMKRKLAFWWLFLCPGFLGAQIGPTTKVVARGEAAIVGEDLPAAREEALVDAQRNALEQVLGVKVRAQTAVQDYHLADDAVLSMISGYVRNSTITQEQRDGDILHLEVACEVTRELSDEEAQKYLRNFSCVIGFNVEVDGKKVEDDRLTTSLSSRLVQANFDVRDLEQLASRKDLQDHYLAALEQQDASAARWIGRQLLSNVVVVGNAKLKQSKKKEVTTFAGVMGVVAYDGWINARAIETESGQIIAQYASPVEGVHGKGETPQDAVTEVLKKAETALSNDLLAQLTTYGGRKSRPVTIEIDGLPTFAEFQRVKSLLNSIRFRDSEVADLGFAEGQTSTFRFDYSENINLIALKLNHIPGLSVITRTGNRVVCRYSSTE